LGFKLVKYEACLREFVSFLEQKKASHITTALAVQFGMLYSQQRPKTQARRYSVVRGFAGYRIGVDPATKIPPCGLVRGGTRRARPYLYSDQEIYQLLEAARNLPSTYSLRPWTYYCSFRLVAVTGLRLALFDQLYASGQTIILVTHEENVALHARRVIRLRDGIVESDTKRS
jgi:integrase/recombinase XerD